jgi:hypothetical protein
MRLKIAAKGDAAKGGTKPEEERSPRSSGHQDKDLSVGRTDFLPKGMNLKRPRFKYKRKRCRGWVNGCDAA